jgi:hypothetical protein
MTMRYHVRYYRDCDWSYGGSEWCWYVSLLLTGEDDPITEETDRTLRIALRRVLDEVYVERHARTIVLEDHSDQSHPTSRIVHLRSSTSRRLQEEERTRRLAIGRRQRALRAARLCRARALVTRITSNPQTRDILQFHRLWVSVSGYGLRDAELRQVLAPAKSGIVGRMLTLARQCGWKHGHREDPKACNRYTDVLYIDTLTLATGYGPFAEVNSGPPSEAKWTAWVLWQGDGLRAGA